MVKAEYKEQVGIGKMPVIWGVHISQEMTRNIETYARFHGVCEGEVFRQAVDRFLATPSARNALRTKVGSKHGK